MYDLRAPSQKGGGGSDPPAPHKFRPWSFVDVHTIYYYYKELHSILNQSVISIRNIYRHELHNDNYHILILMILKVSDMILSHFTHLKKN